MSLPGSGTLYISNIRDEFYNTTVNGLYYGTGSELYTLNHYRGRYYYNAPSGGTLFQFSTGSIYMSNFHGAGANCACTCDCDCSNCGGNCGNGCFVAGAMVMMASGEMIPIEDVKIGDKVLTLDGVGTVVKTPIYTLGSGRHVVTVTTKDGLQKITMSDDHSLWTKFDDKQWWGTYNYSHYLYEMEDVSNNDGEGPQLTEHSRPLVRGKHYLHATLGGFKEAKISYSDSDKYTPDTKLYHLIVDTGSYMVDSFIVSSSPRDEYYTNSKWFDGVSKT